MKMDINQMLDRFSEISVFDHSVLALFLILGLSLLFTILHTLEELKGRGGPLYLPGVGAEPLRAAKAEPELEIGI